LFDIGLFKIKFIGGEPSLRKDLPEIIAEIRSWSPSLDISMITNGVWPEKNVDKYKKAGISRINVSLHSINKSLDTRIAFINQTISNVQKLKKCNLLSKVNFVLMKDKNEKELEDVILWAGENKLIVDVLNMLYSPDTEKKHWHYYYNMSEIEELILKMFPAREVKDFIPLNGLKNKRLHLKNAAIINLKTTQLRKHKPYRSCDKCPIIDWCVEGISSIRLTVDGKIKPCLFRSDNIFNLKEINDLDGKEKAEQALLEYLYYL
jgi:cyclic pyranopterin phosphate synthase